MTYLQFHFAFIAPFLLLLAPALPRAIRAFGPRAAWSLPAVALIALVFTTPWDNYLVYRGVWWYGADRVLGTIGYVPVEEYVFFVLQPLLTGLWTFTLLLRDRSADIQRGPHVRAPQRALTGLAALGDARLLGAGVYLLAAAGGVFALTWPSGLYVGLILAWAAPVLAAQWFFCAGEVVRRPRLIAAAVGVPTLWLWIADRIAIGAGIWSISPEATTGLHLFGLPMEEATFFLVTNLLVVQGVLLFMAPALEAVRARGTGAAAPHAGRAVAPVPGAAR